MPHLENDFIIIGQGLAGSILSAELIRKGQKVLVIDNAHKGSSSRVAAGIINPITGHRLNISDRFFEFYRCASDYYQSLELVLQQKVFTGINQTRLIKNKGQLDYLNKRLTQADYQNLLRSSDSNDFIETKFGVIDIKQSSLVDTKKLLDAAKQWLKTQNSHVETEFNYNDLTHTKTGIQIGPWRSKKIIFCEGHQAINNPWLNHLPFKLAKGEILTLDLAAKCPDRMLNWGQWLVPSFANKGYARLGSNFIWNDLSFKTSTENKNKMLSSLQKETGLHGAVLHHETGIRPTTTERKPFIGALSMLENSYCFNGFGSKGCLIIPYYAKLLSEHLLRGKPLPDEVSKWV